MHILFLTDNFPPEVNAPASRTFEHCRAWVEEGHRVTVITGVPNFPGGKVYSGYRNRVWQTEMMDGIRVIRVWTYIVANVGFLKRIIDYISYMVSAILASPFVKRPNIVVATSPLLFTACAGYAVGRIHKIPFVFELRDIWPESIKAVGAMKDSFVIRFFERVEMFLYKNSARIVSVTNSFKQQLIERGVDGEKIEVITNGVDLSRFRLREKDAKLNKRYGLQGKFVAGYIGTHGMAHALETILNAAARINDIKEQDDFRFMLLGNGARKDDLLVKAKQMGLRNLVFIDSVPKQEVVRYWSLLDVSIIHLKKTPLFKSVIPSKLFESMGMGIPILHGVEGESAEIIRTENVGIPFEPENDLDLVEKLRKLKSDKHLYEQLRANCIASSARYDRSELAGRMLKILEVTVHRSERHTKFQRVDIS